MKAVTFGRKLLIGVLVLFVGALVLPIIAHGATIYVDDDNTGGPWDGTPEHPYRYIQDGVDNASSGDTVYVFNGTYYESVVVSKTINLIGEDKENTIIDGGDVDRTCVHVTAHYVNISGFMIRNGGSVYPNAGIYVDYSDYTIISGNIITNNGLHGILLSGSSENDISGNIVTENNYVGIYLEGSSNNNTVSQNTISYNSWGLDVDRSDDNVIFRNAIIHNYEYGLMLYYSNNNSIYHNDIINKDWNAVDKWQAINNWDDGYPSGGNYWSDYTGSDSFSGPEQNIPGSDGIGDAPYDNIPGGNNQDNYPLMTTVLGLYADPHGPYTGNVNETIQFTGSAHGGVPPYNWHWDFGDGNTSNQQNPTHSFDTPGFYTVALTVIDSNNSIAIGYVTVRVLHSHQSYVWVDDDFNESTPGWRHDHFDNIQDGVDISGYGGTVYVYSGIYYENVVVDKTVNLFGENKETTIIDAGGDGNCVHVIADSVSISGFTVRNNGGIMMDTGGMLISSSYNTITNNNAKENLHYGILIMNEYSGGLHDNTLSDNVITSNWKGVLVSGFGGTSYDNTVSDNIITHNSLIGVQLQGDLNSVITRNIITDNQYGIVATEPGSHSCIISRNTISNCHEGITNDYWSSITDGIILQNNILDNDYGILLRIGNNTLIYHNNFINNSQHAADYSYYFDNSWDNGYPSGGNYWDDYTGSDSFSGPEQNIPGSDGIGDTPYEFDYNQDSYPLMDPWIIYICGDANFDEEIGIGDIVYLINYLYRNGDSPKCYPLTACADVNVDGVMDLGDVVYFINYLFRGGPPLCE